MSDDKTIAVYDARARDYVDLVARNRPDRDLRAFMQALPAGAEVLDLGCGPGNSAAILQEAGFKVEAMDASAEMVAMARDRYGVNARQAVFDDLSGTDLYDGVWANFSLLHAPKSDMPRHLAALRDAIKPGGVLHIGLKLGEGEHRDKIGRLYSYYEEAELVALLEAAGFRPRTPRFGEEAGLSGEVAKFIILLCDA